MLAGGEELSRARRTARFLELCASLFPEREAGARLHQEASWSDGARLAGPGRVEPYRWKADERCVFVAGRVQLEADAREQTTEERRSLLRLGTFVRRCSCSRWAIILASSTTLRMRSR